MEEYKPMLYTWSYRPPERRDQGSGGWSVHGYLSMFREFFEIAGIPVIRRGVIKGFGGICGARGFVFC